ncbi:MAG: hypothetical protein IE889_03975 [Campylobacterales bacterium]|nr:hypothetical protein [Campylobacterales bacterium]
MVEVYSGYTVEGEYDVSQLVRHGRRKTQAEIIAKSQEQERLEAENAQLQAEIEKLQQQTHTADKKEHTVTVKGLSEKETRSG